jgi:hypothetical protein
VLAPSRAKPKAVRAGQIRGFRIVKLDPGAEED